MRPYDLYSVETWHQRHICTVSARGHAECERKAWKRIAKKAPGLVGYFKKNGFQCLLESKGGWGNADFAGR